MLVGIDGSPRQAAVLSTAWDLALRMGARMVVLRAVTVTKELPPEALLMPEEEIARILELRAHVELNQALATLPKGLEVEGRVEHGQAWRAIVRVAAEVGADLIVIGAHGYGAVARLLGTTAARVVEHADRSVFVVR